MGGPPLVAGRRVVVVTFDACDRDLVLDWARRGELPAFAALLEQSARAFMTAPRGFYVGGVWPSFATSTSAAVHGFFCFRQIVPGSYREPLCPVESMSGEVFWEPLARAGRRVAVVDLPRVPLSHDLNGVQLADWGNHDPVHPQPVSWPAGLAGEIERRYGRSTIGDCDLVDHSAPGLHHFCDSLVSRAETKAAIALDLFAREPWDLFAVGFSESHCVGHQCWHLHDPEDARFDPAARESLGDPLLRVYRALDAALGRIASAVSPDTSLFVVLSHGMGSHYDAMHLLDEVLIRLDGQTPALAARVFHRINKLWKQLPPSVHRLIPSLDRSVKHRMRAQLLDADRGARRFFPITNSETHPGIRINLRGREPAGRVAPGAEFDALCREIRDELLALVDERGQPVVRTVLDRRELCEGPRADVLPDLVIEWSRTAPVDVVRSPRIGTVRGRSHAIRSGDHRPQGMLLVRAPGVASGQLASQIEITDVAPTVCALLGSTLPAAEGRRLDELWDGARI